MQFDKYVALDILNRVHISIEHIEERSQPYHCGVGIIGTIIFVLAIMAILRMPISRLFFPIMLGSYVASIVAISAYFEENT